MGLDNINYEVDAMFVKLENLRNELKLLEKEPEAPEYQKLAEEITITEKKYTELLLLRIKKHY